MVPYKSEDVSLYKRIADEIRRNIIAGIYQPGYQIPSIRALSNKWNCTPGTIQRAFRELAQQGLIVSRVGKGTRVVDQVNEAEMMALVPVRKAILIHRTESFLLESIIAGYSFDEIEESLDLARKSMQLDEK